MHNSLASSLKICKMSLELTPHTKLYTKITLHQTGGRGITIFIKVGFAEVSLLIETSDGPVNIDRLSQTISSPNKSAAFDIFKECLKGFID